MNPLRIFSFIALGIITIAAPWWIVLPFAVAYAFKWKAYELVIVGALIDVYFGAAVGVPYYTLGAFTVLLALEWIKPHLAFHS